MLLAGFAIEGALSLCFLIWAEAKHIPLRLHPEVNDAAISLLLTLPLLAANYIFYILLAPRWVLLKQCLQFVDQVVKPLADSLSLPAMAIISIIAGIGEELFFRGLLQQECGLILTSALFAVMHLGPAIKEYPIICCCYFLAGLYLGLIYQWQGSLWCPVIVHAAYDLLALVFMRFVYRASTLAGK